MPSTLFRVAAAPVIKGMDGDVSDSRYIVVGQDANGVYCHGQDGAPIPKNARVLQDGKTAWTWNQVAQQMPADAAELMPHEWAGEPTAKSLDIRPFTKEAARRATSVEEPRVR